MSEFDLKIARINALARKSREGGLSEEERLEQHWLRRWYIDAMKASLRGRLASIRYVDSDGNISRPGQFPG